MSGGQDGAQPPASAPPKPRLKINVNRSSSFATPNEAAPPSATAATPSQQTPLTATPGGDGAQRKVKLKITPSQPPTPAAEATPIKTKAGRQPKPTQKLVDSKKRPAEDDDDDDDAPLAQSHPATKIKLKHTSSMRVGSKGAGPTQITVKHKGKPPYHPPGDGYDSEASDREIDPAIEEQLVLRLPPGEHADYLRQMMEAGKIGVPRLQGGADFHIKLFDEDTRRGMIHVKGQNFAAVMVDLPTITEAMKTWDRKSLMKSADICQMLLAFQKVKNEDEAKKAPLPSIIDGHFKWPHGLTPPMHDCVNRRFAKTISRKEIEDKEAEVERLLLEDGKAASTKWEWVDDRQEDEEEEDSSEGEEEEEDAEGEDADGMDYFGEAEDYGDLEDAMEAAFADAADETLVTDTPAAGTEAPTPLTATQIDTPGVALQDSIEADESEEDESGDDDDDDDDDELDDDERAQRDEEQGIKDIIADMQKQLAAKQTELAKQPNRILKTRIENQIRELKSEIELKMSSIGMEADE